MNLYIVSTLGQIKQVNKYINKKIKSKVIIINYGNQELMRNICSNVKKECDSLVINIPYNDNHKINKKKLFDIVGLIMREPYENIFLCSFQTFYNYFNYFAKRNGVKVHLVEEGIGTYNLLLKTNIKEQLKENLRLLINQKEILYRLSPNKKRKIMRCLTFFMPRYYSEYYKIINKYETINVVFPEKLKKVFTANKFKAISNKVLISNENRKIILAEIKEKSPTFFVNQTFGVDDFLHVETCLDILFSKFNKKDIYIKLHPKDTKEIKSVFIEQIKKRKYPYRVLDFKIEIPFEEVLSCYNKANIISIASSTLVYSGILNSNFRSYSIKNDYFSKVKNSDVPEDVISFIRYNISVINIFYKHFTSL